MVEYWKGSSTLDGTGSSVFSHPKWMAFHFLDSHVTSRTCILFRHDLEFQFWVSGAERTNRGRIREGS